MRIFASAHITRDRLCVAGRRWQAVVLLLMFALSPATTFAQGNSDALLRLMIILRDRGSITGPEFEELRRVIGGADDSDGIVMAPTTAVAPATPPIAAAQDVAARPAPANRWYERLGLRGYTQFRASEVWAGNGAPLEMPSDRSANENETFVVRRGRFILSGDITDRLSIYAQPDLNASTGSPDFSLQLRDLYADVSLNDTKTFRLRLGQSKVPFSFANLQSSQNRAPFERPDALNFAADGERDLGAYIMWTPARARTLFRDLVNRGLKGSGDYGVVAIGAYAGQGPNRPDQNGQPHWVARASYPFTLASGQIVELGVQGYAGRFVTSTQTIVNEGQSITPAQPAEGALDERVAISVVWYPQPLGFEFEWNWGRGPELAGDLSRIDASPLQGGAIQVHYRRALGAGWWFPFARWQYYDGGRKFARNAPRTVVNELDFGLELARWAEVELTGVYTRTFERTRTTSYPYSPARDTNRFGLQAQWTY